MYRKFLAATVAFVILGGAVFAEEIMAIFVKCDNGKLTVKVDDKEKTYTVDPDAKVKIKDNEVSLTKILENEKIYKEGTKVTLTVEKDKVTKVTRERKKKNN